MASLHHLDRSDAVGVAAAKTRTPTRWNGERPLCGHGETGRSRPTAVVRGAYQLQSLLDSVGSLIRDPGAVTTRFC